MIWLKVGEERFPLREGETTLGRSQYCTVYIPSAAASREHAVLVRDRDTLTLKDLGSRNGTALNGRRIQGPESVVVGDIITLGSCDARVVAGVSVTDEMMRTVEKVLPRDRLGSRETVPEMRELTDSAPPTIMPTKEQP